MTPRESVPWVGPSWPQAIDVVYVAQNYLEVVQLLFCNSGQAPAVERHSGLW